MLDDLLDGFVGDFVRQPEVDTPGTSLDRRIFLFELGDVMRAARLHGDVALLIS